MHFIKINYRYLLFLFLLFGSQPLLSQDSAASSKQSKKWQFTVEPYMMFPNMSGNTGVDPLPLVEVNAGVSDIFSRLQFGAMLYLEASNDKWAINSDLLFMNLEQDISPTKLINNGRMNAKQLGWELAGLRRVTPWLELGIGGLLNSLDMEINVTRNELGGGTTELSGSETKTWFDPMLIARLTTPRGKKFLGQFRGEVGGFGIGSDFAWQVQAIAGYRFTKLFELSAGYRAIGLDYQSAVDAKTFIYDMVTFGPMIRFGFHF
jgi:hypothetical protein